MKKLSLLVCVLGLLCSCSSNDDNDTPPGYSIEIKNIETLVDESKIKVSFKLTDANNVGIANQTDSDFNLYERAVNAGETEQLIDPAEAPRLIVPNPQNYRYATMIVMDVSGSVIDEIDNIKSAATLYVSNLFSEINSGALEVAIYYFDGREQLQELIDFSSSSQDIITAISGMSQALQEDRSTNLYGAVVQSCNRMQAKKIEIQNDANTNIWSSSIVFFSDGKNQDFFSNRSDMNASINATTFNTGFYVIGAGSDIDTSVISDIGRNGQFLIDNYSQLNTGLNNVLDAIKGEANSNYELEICTAKSGTEVVFRLASVGTPTNGGTGTYDTNNFTGNNCTIN
ncbi:von Willebrand factor type A domain protein [Kordia sp. SMS9]|uniref:VWA domain-containing protein n=1 Tax=Kordia sp. SMS9 TaxID=2282170 RepID=UPI000E0D60CC|nr:vWA domain-containing protein [Kordia sp. SMS9]AXG72162.1 von Willebrand factor type A domain protein [Kordia sp. SMS9]